MRILIVSHSALGSEQGASQTALKLAAALTELGHTAEAWSPEPLPPRARWWSIWRWQRRNLEAHLEVARPYDVIDAPAVSISPRVAARAAVVARSVQPDFRYAWVGLTAALRSALIRPHALVAHAVQSAMVLPAIVQGWRRAGVILCLGSCERRWMERRFPWTRPKLGTYVEAPSAADQRALAAVRAGRERGTGDGVRFLWIGRWAAHKGPATLLRFIARRAAGHPGDTFTLAGCGEAARRHCPRALMEAGRIRVVPSFTRQELPALVAGCDAGLFTSSVEGWGLSLNEMLESGLPVFATRAGGVEDLEPFFPRTLRPFPPPGDLGPSQLAATDHPAARGYFRRFSWSEIGRRYHREVLGRLEGEAPAAGGR